VCFRERVAVAIPAGTEGHESASYPVNGLETAKEFAQTESDELELIFDGAGTEWIPELEDEDSDYHELYQSVRDDASVCDFCAGAFGVEEAVADSGLVTWTTTMAIRVTGRWSRTTTRYYVPERDLLPSCTATTVQGLDTFSLH
jgi:hypothetical protein